MRLIMSFFAALTSVYSMESCSVKNPPMSDPEFMNLGGVLRHKYGVNIPSGGEGGEGCHKRTTNWITHCNVPGSEYRITVRYERPYNYGLNGGIKPLYKTINFSFGGKNLFENLSIKKVNWCYCFSNDLYSKKRSDESLITIWEHNLVPFGLYYFVLDELEIEDPRLQIPTNQLIRKIAQNLPENPTFLDFQGLLNAELNTVRGASHKEILFSQVMAELMKNCFHLPSCDPLPEKKETDNLFLTYLMNDYFMETLREKNFSLLQRRIYFLTSENHSDEDLKEITFNELKLISNQSAREDMIFKLITDLRGIFPVPFYVVDLCNLIDQISPNYAKALDIKGDTILCSSDPLAPINRYAPIIESCLVNKETERLNNFVRLFISDGKLDAELPKDLENLDANFDSIMRLLNHIRELRNSSSM